jgi:hypothetical protein
MNENQTRTSRKSLNAVTVVEFSIVCIEMSDTNQSEGLFYFTPLFSFGSSWFFLSSSNFVCSLADHEEEGKPSVDKDKEGKELKVPPTVVEITKQKLVLFSLFQVPCCLAFFRLSIFCLVCSFPS